MIQTIDEIWEVLKICPFCSFPLMFRVDFKDRDGIVHIVHNRNDYDEEDDCAFGIWNTDWDGEKKIYPSLGNFFFWVGRWEMQRVEMSFDDFQRRLKLESFK